MHKSAANWPLGYALNYDAILGIWCFNISSIVTAQKDAI